LSLNSRLSCFLLALPQKPSDVGQEQELSLHEETFFSVFRRAVCAPGELIEAIVD
jgi:hypothetical protein